MKCKILHETISVPKKKNRLSSPNTTAPTEHRMRIHVMQSKMTFEQADILEYYLTSVPNIRSAKVYDRTKDAVIVYTCSRDKVIDILVNFNYEENEWLLPEHSSREINHKYEDKMFFLVTKRIISRFLLPYDLRLIMRWVKTSKYISIALKSLLKGKMDVSVLDATAITTAMISGDNATAGSIMFLLKLGEILEEWTYTKSIDNLAKTMSLNVDKVWLCKDGTEVLVPINDICEGDEIIVHAGNPVPLDGVVTNGEAMINQASITGEPLAVRKAEGGYVYAGTVINEGEITYKVDKVNGTGKYDRIVKMIEESEKLKSQTEAKAYHLADKLVPYSLAGTLLTYLLTRNATRAISVLMVDYSCALKLAMPLSVLSAMRNAGEEGITVKGGLFLEAVSEATTIIFDKTGTLTHATPKVANIITFQGYDENETLSIAACLEEHFPHSMAKAVVKEAEERGCSHQEEKHSKVEYVVAHGIASTVNNEKVIIGSYHFVFEDENCTIPEGEESKVKDIPPEYSPLYMGVSGVLRAIILVEDPIREEAPQVVEALHNAGFTKVVMMTGDNKNTAKMISEKAGIDEYYAEVLPEDKANFVKMEHELGNKVIMVGDGINDSPALSEADAGIAISDGAAIAREISDITIQSDDLYSIVYLRNISTALMKRINSNYRSIISFNTGLIILGALGILTPGTAAILHNSSTLLIGAKSMTDLDY